MTDGTTGFQVAPITEDEMNRVQAILKRAIDATMAFSQIAADVTMLRDTVAGLQADAEQLRNRNNALDEALNYSRAERDRMSSALNNQALDLANANDRASQFQAKADKLTLANDQLTIDLDLARKDRDNAELQAMVARYCDVAAIEQSTMRETL